MATTKELLSEVSLLYGYIEAKIKKLRNGNGILTPKRELLFGQLERQMSFFEDERRQISWVLKCKDELLNTEEDRYLENPPTTGKFEDEHEYHRRALRRELLRHYSSIQNIACRHFLVAAVCPDCYKFGKVAGCCVLCGEKVSFVDFWAMFSFSAFIWVASIEKFKGQKMPLEQAIDYFWEDGTGVFP